MQTFTFEDDGKIPNNALSLIVYPGALPEHDVTACKRLFEQHNWHNSWVNGVFSYHHYHSTAHEVLGCVSGSAKVQFGGEQGKIIEISAGDVVVIPAGVGHCNKGASGDFRVVGAYPNGQGWDVKTGAPGERPQVLENIAQVPLPDQDPVHGTGGGLRDIWK
jgi:uncharacterized protein YjlB